MDMEHLLDLPDLVIVEEEVKPKQKLASHVCKYCTRWFHNTPKWFEHQRRHKDRIEPYWYKKNAKKRSRITYACSRDLHVVVDSENKEPIASEQLIMKFHCRYCRKKFTDQNDWKQHEEDDLKRKRYLCKYSDCNKRFLNPCRLRSHERVHTKEKPYACQFCGKKFSHIANTRLHERIHTKEKPYSCKFCDKKFASNANKRRHELCKHMGVKTFYCKYCHKLFFDINERRHHETGIHLIPKFYPFSCSFCNKPLSGNKAKMLHERSHTKEKPYGCSFCTNKFSTNDGRKSHEILVHSTERPYQCSYCDKRYALRKQKLAHERHHLKVYPCRCCARSFDTGSARQIHERMTHTVERSLPCSFCDRKFTGHSARKRHEMWHRNDRPHKCSYCEKRFITAQERRRHEKVHLKPTLQDLVRVYLKSTPQVRPQRQQPRERQQSAGASQSQIENSTTKPFSYYHHDVSLSSNLNSSETQVLKPIENVIMVSAPVPVYNFIPYQFVMRQNVNYY